MNEITRQLRLLQKRYGLSQSDFCDKFKLNRTTYISWCNQDKNPSGTTETYLKCILKEPEIMANIVKMIDET